MLSAACRGAGKTPRGDSRRTTTQAMHDRKAGTLQALLVCACRPRPDAEVIPANLGARNAQATELFGAVCHSYASPSEKRGVDVRTSNGRCGFSLFFQLCSCGMYSRDEGRTRSQKKKQLVTASCSRSKATTPAVYIGAEAKSLAYTGVARVRVDSTRSRGCGPQQS